jgi:hypothetical protein
VRAWLGGIGWKRDATTGNGSGLFSSNRFSPRAIRQLPSGRLSRLPFGPTTAAASLSRSPEWTAPSAGMRAARPPNGAGEPTLSGVSTLSGYAALDGRAPLVFSILVNGFSDQQADSARVLQNEICEAMIPFLESGRR